METFGPFAMALARHFVLPSTTALFNPLNLHPFSLRSLPPRSSPSVLSLFHFFLKTSTDNGFSRLASYMYKITKPLKRRTIHQYTNVSSDKHSLIKVFSFPTKNNKKNLKEDQKSRQTKSHKEDLKVSENAIKTITIFIRHHLLRCHTSDSLFCLFPTYRSRPGVSDLRRGRVRLFHCPVCEKALGVLTSHKWYGSCRFPCWTAGVLLSVTSVPSAIYETFTQADRDVRGV